MTFWIRRIVFYIVTLWAAISLNFLLPRMLPGDPAAIMLGKLRRANGNRPLSEETISAITSILGAEKGSTLWDQYLAYWGRMLHGDLGISSTRYPAPVGELIAAALPWTVTLVGAATIISFVLGIVAGAWAGWKRARAFWNWPRPSPRWRSESPRPLCGSWAPTTANTMASPSGPAKITWPH